MNRNRDLLLGIDLGTTAVKAAAYDEFGTLAAVGSHEYDLVTGANGMVEVAAETVWQALVDSVHSVIASSTIDPRQISALALSCQGETQLVIGDRDQVLGNAIVWLDSRAVAESDELASAFDHREFYEITGQPQMLATWPAAKWRWLGRHQPHVLRLAKRLSLLEDYIILRMTGEFVTEGSLATSTCYWNFRTKQWWPEMLDALEISPEKLPSIVEPGTRIGSLLPAVADELGLSARTAVCTGALDQACGAIGVGNVAPGRLSENTGAAVALCATLDQPVLDPKMRIPCHYHGIPDRYMLHTFTSGGVVLQWFRDQLCESERATARNMGVDAYELLSLEAANVAPGCDGLIAIPHFQGAMAPDSNSRARGAFVGLTLTHSRAHLARAIMESVVYVIRRNVEVFGELQAAPTGVWALGGGAKSAVWKQIEADVLQLPITVVAEQDAATLGAAILAGVATGRYGHVAEAAGQMVPTGATYQPNPSMREVYDEGYGRYQQTYQALCPVFDRMTGETSEE
jgi:sugar (pentulose or hexulose) kinase